MTFIITAFNMKKMLVVGIILLFLGLSIPALANSDCKNSSPLSHTLYVGGTGPGNYSTIQAAVENSSDGDTIFVFKGIYNGNYIHIKKSIKLIGESRNDTVINGNLNDGAIMVFASNVTITGFTIQNMFIALEMNGVSNVSITNNRIIDNKYGCMIESKSLYTYFYDNIVSDNSIVGLAIDNSYHTFVKHNNFKNNKINLEISDSDYYIKHDCYHTITGNNFFGNLKLVSITSAKGNTWDNNFWEHHLYGPKFIFGKCKIWGGEINIHWEVDLYIPMIQIDQHAAISPNYIP